MVEVEIKEKPVYINSERTVVKLTLTKYTVEKVGGGGVCSAVKYENTEGKWFIL